jgi:phosphohistidine phosphatase
MAQHLVDADLVPVRIVVSSAVRTQETVARMRAVFGDVETIVEPDLYLASTVFIKDIVEAHMREVSPLMVVGHNPAMEMLASSVSQELVVFPTAALAHIEVEPDAPPRLVAVWRPKELPAP